MMLLDNNFDLGDIVFLKTDPDQMPRMVVEIRACLDGCLYVLSLGSDTSIHYDLEISKQKKYANL